MMYNIHKCTTYDGQKGGYVMPKKYALNTKTKVLHKIGECRFTIPLVDQYWKTYDILDAVITENKENYRKCRICFKNE